jgi:hypothetical protein
VVCALKASCFHSTLLLLLYVNSKHCVQFSYEMGHVVGKIPHLFCADPDKTFSKENLYPVQDSEAVECRIE